MADCRHLIHLGYAKTGSTLLRRWFASHPQLAFTEGGIAGYRSVYEIATRAAAPPGEVRYRVTSSEGLSTPHPDLGAPTETYDRAGWTQMAARQEAVCDALADLFPAAHILVVTRGFRSMVLSAYSQFVRTGGDLDFGEFCAGVRADAASPDAAWDYDRLLRLYTARFTAERVIALPYELLRDDAPAFFRAIADRLELRHHPPVEGRPNPALSPTELAWYPRAARLLRALPARGRLRRAYARSAYRNRFRHPIVLLQSLRPAAPVEEHAVPAEVVEAYRGRASSLRGLELYRPYAAAYLHD